MFEALKTAYPLLTVIFPLLTALLGIIGMFALIQRRYPKFIVSMVLSALSMIATAGLPTSVKTPSAPKPESPVVNAPTPTASSSTATQHMPWEFIGFVLVIVFIIAVLAVGLIFIVPHIKKKTNSKSENLRAWKDVIKRHEDVRKQWASYEMDMSKIIDMPVMTDMREPVVIALHKALKTASSVAPESLAKLAYTPVQGSAFLTAVNDLEIAFQSAEQTAKKLAWRKFTKEERRSLSTAKNLLSLAMDSGASPAERQAAYKRVFKELQGIIEFPEKVRLEIESRHQLALAA